MKAKLKNTLKSVRVLLMLSTAMAVAATAEAQIEEIIVIAEKREVSLQEAPLAISAITEAALEEQSVFNVADMTARIPTLVVNKSEGTDRTITLRGMGKSGSSQNGTIRQSVAYHQDGVYYRNSLAANQDLFDVERVEVIRGPTGTVFGQSSIGGVINVITKRPDLDGFSGHVDLSAGTEGNRGGRLYVNVPLSDTLAVRGSFQNRRHDGYSKNVFLGVPLDEENNTSAKLQLLWRPADNLDVLFRASSFEIEENNGRAQKGLLDTTSGTRNLNQNFAGLFNFENEDISLEIDYEADWFNVKAISAYQDARTGSRSDNDRANLAPDARPGYITDNRILNFQQDRDQFSQEITFSSNNGNSPFTWLVGAFYLEADGEIEFIEGLDRDSDGLIPDWDQIRNVDETLLFGNQGFIFRGIEKLTSTAFYGQVTYDLTDRLRVFGGVRMSEDKSDPDNSFFFGDFGPGNSTKLDSTDYKIGLEYSLSDDVLSYVTFASGSKPNGGSLTSGAPGGLITLENFAVPPVFAEEENEAIEIGVKARAMDDRLQINSAFYVYDLSNYQFLSDNPTPFGGGAVNAPAVDMWGLETEITALLTDNFRLDFSVGYLDTELNGFTPALDTINANGATAASAIMGFDLFSPENIAARQAQVEDLDGNELPAAPEITYNLSATYTTALSSGAEMDFNMNYAYRDDFYARIYNHPVADVVPSQGLLAATIRYVPPDANWSIELIGSNLTDDKAISNTYTDIFGVGATGREFNPPRVIMLRLNADF